MIDFFVNKYPYTDFHELNLDWLISKLLAMDNKLTNFVSLNTIKYADPIQWDITRQYETNTVVLDANTGIAYISSQPVPSGVSISNPDYWSVIFDLQQIIGYINENLTVHNDGSSPTSTFTLAVGDWVLWNGRLYKVLVPMSPGYAYIEGSNIEAHSVEELVNEYINALYVYIGALSDLTTTDTSSIVGAINSLVTDINNTIGDLNDLTTTDKSSVVNAINSLLTDINNTIGDLNDLTTTDKSSVVNAINDLVSALTNVVNNIGDLDSLTTTDKSSLVNAINEVASYSGKLIVYNPSDMFGLVNTGLVDCSTILSGITDNVGLKAGTYLISTTCIINANILIPEGAKFSIASGVTVTFNGYIDAGLYEIFTGAGDVLIRGNSEVYPEWYGAKNDITTDSTTAIQKAFNSIKAGAVILQAGKYNLYQDTAPTLGYYTTDTITITASQSDVSIKCRAGKAVIYSTANVCISLQGNTDNQITDFISNATLENLIIYYRGTVPTPSGYNATIGIKIHGGIRNVTRNTEIYRYLTGIYSDTIVAHYVDACTMHAPNKLYATNIYLNDDIINNAIYPNASFHVDNSIFFGASQTVGLTAKGDILSDLFVRNNEFGGHYEAVSMEIDTGGNSALDIHITDNIIDNCYRGIDINAKSTVNSCMNIRGNWIAPSGDFAIQLTNTYAVIIANNNIVGNLSSNVDGIRAISSNQAIITENQILNCTKGIATNNSIYMTICSNVVSSDRASTNAIEITSAQISNISNNIIRRLTNGSYNYAIVLTGTGNAVNWNRKAGTVNNSIASGNIVDGANT